MKYENFEKAKSIVEEIRKKQKLIDELSSDNIYVKILDSNYTVMTIGTWSSCEHSQKDLAKEFILKIVQVYASEIAKLHGELQEL